MADPERRKRFIHEARTASGLNHPNIITIHDINTAGGIDFIAMEFVAGKPLAQLIGDKGLPLRETLKYSVQIADALEKAHRAGIVHRDLKPSNIMVTEDGLVKVLDFGLAKLMQAAVDDADLTKSAESMTQSGAIVGTAAYMSPEQAEGKAVDARSDIFTFGAVLYEMVTGRRAFKGTSHISTLSAILHEEPEPVSRIAAGIPQELERIIARCLKKDPARRFQHMDDVKVALEELKEVPAKHRRRQAIYWVVAATAVVVLATGGWTLIRFLSREATLPPPRIVPVTNYPGVEYWPSLSPDGRWVAFTWDGEKGDNHDIWVKEVDGTGLNRLTSDPAMDLCPTWSPDGRQIAFARVTGDRLVLFVTSPLGGGEQKLTEYIGYVGLSWSSDGKNIAIAAKASSTEPWSIWSVAVLTREKEQLTHPPPGVSFGDTWPTYSPDGRYIAFTRMRELSTPALYVMPLPHGDARLLTDRYSPTAPCWTVDSRELVFSSTGFTGAYELWRISKDGGEPASVPARGVRLDKPSIAGRRLAYGAYAGNCDIWRVELSENRPENAQPKHLLSWTTDELSADISPDGRRVVFISNRSGSNEVWVCNSDGSKPVQLTDIRAGSTGSPRWSPDGKVIAFDSTKSGNSDIYVVGAEGGQPRLLTAETTEEVTPRWSRDGRWIYFGSNRSGTTMQIWKVPSEGGRATQITRDGGMAASESPDGYLYYSAQINQKKGIWRVPLSGGPETLVTEVTDVWCFWELTDRGIYFIASRHGPQLTLCLYDLRTRRVKTLAYLEPDFDPSNGVSVSPNGEWLLFSGDGEIPTSDVMLIDNFR
jgi:Tol biopolymer transport system component